MTTRATWNADSKTWSLSGSKMWITNSPEADVFIIWAKSVNDPEYEKSVLRGFILEKGMPGLTAPKIEGKLSLRAGVTGSISMDEVVVGEEHRIQVVLETLIFWHFKMHVEIMFCVSVALFL